MWKWKWNLQAVDRDTEMQSELWVRAWDKRPGCELPVFGIIKVMKMVPARGRDTGRHSRSRELLTLWMTKRWRWVTPVRWTSNRKGEPEKRTEEEERHWVDCERDLCWGSLIRGTSSSCFWVTSPWISGFMERDIRDPAMGNQGRASQETSVCVCEWGVWGVKQGPVRSLELPLWGDFSPSRDSPWCWQCDCHSLGMVRPGSFLNKITEPASQLLLCVAKARAI